MIVAAHDEAAIIADKIRDIRASDLPSELVEIVVASDGSCDGTVPAAAHAGSDVVLDLPRVGKVRALEAAVAHSRGEILVFTDADSMFEPETLAALLANFADDRVGAVAANEVHAEATGTAVAEGEGLYWRYEQWIKRAEDRVGSAVSASGRLYAVRRALFRPLPHSAIADDFAISTQVIGAGFRLAFDPNARVVVQLPAAGRSELRRKVRVMNGGLRAAFALLSLRLVRARPAYVVQLVSHKILRRFVPFLLATMFVASVFGAGRNPVWWFVLGPQLLFYALAAAGAVAQVSGRRSPRAFSVPYYFSLANIAAALAVLSLVAGVRYEKWESVDTRAVVVGGKLPC